MHGLNGGSVDIRVIEYGDGWKLENYFRSVEKARDFAERLVKSSCKGYKKIGPNKWYCKSKDTHIEIEL